MKLAAALRLALTVIAAAVFLLIGKPARAEFVPPPFSTSVLDQAGKLSPGEHAYLTAKIEKHRRATGFVVAVYLPASLDGESIEDVAYKTFQTWKLGDKEKDNGVLLVIAPSERKTRIETGKGTGGALTDLQTNVGSTASTRRSRKIRRRRPFLAKARSRGPSARRSGCSDSCSCSFPSSSSS
jgi:uncharacterized protein